MEVIDLSHYIEEGMQIYPGDPEPKIEPCLIHDRDYCHVDRLSLGSHTGTHIDAPYHFLKDGKKISDFPADKFIGRAVVVNVTDLKGNQEIPLERLLPYDPFIQKDIILLFMTGYDEYFGQEAYLSHPYLSAQAAGHLVKKGVKIVGTDALNIDSTQNEDFAAHDILLSSDILIIENLCKLKHVTEYQDAIFSFLPLKLAGTDGSPIRAACLIP